MPIHFYNIKSMLHLFVIIASLFFAYQLNINYPRPAITISMQEAATNIDDNIFSFFHLGNKRMLSSVLWVKTLLDSDLDHYKQKDLNSWMYLRFKSIAIIDPWFYENYLVGGQYLSIVKDDDWGAGDLYRRGYRFFPDDIILNFNMGYHYFFELEDINRATFHFNKIANTSWARNHATYIPSLVAKLIAQRGDLSFAKEMAQTAYAQAPPDSNIKERLYQSLYAITAEIDLVCLNGASNIFDNSKKNPKLCAKKDYDGNPYLYSTKDEKYYAKKIWKPFRPSRPAATKGDVRKN